MSNTRRSRCCNGTVHELASAIGPEIRGRFQDLTLEPHHRRLDVRGSTTSYYALQLLVTAVTGSLARVRGRQVFEVRIDVNVGDENALFDVICRSDREKRDDRQHANQNSHSCETSTTATSAVRGKH